MSFDHKVLQIFLDAMHGNTSFTVSKKGKREKKRTGKKKRSAAFLHPRPVKLEKLKDGKKKRETLGCVGVLLRKQCVVW